MYQVKYHLKSVSPYIQNNPESKVDEIRDSSTPTRIGKQQDNFLKTGYKNDLGYYIPFRQIKGMMFKAGMKVKLGRANIAQFVRSSMFCDEHQIPMMNKGEVIKNYDFKYNDPVLKKDGKMVFSPRVAFNSWEIIFTLNILMDSIPQAKVTEILVVGGYHFGLGSRRPDYGRFMVEEIV